jgi:hypothetical protein
LPSPTFSVLLVGAFGTRIVDAPHGHADRDFRGSPGQAKLAFPGFSFVLAFGRCYDGERRADDRCPLSVEGLGRLLGSCNAASSKNRCPNLRTLGQFHGLEHPMTARLAKPVNRGQNCAEGCHSDDEK